MKQYLTLALLLAAFPSLAQTLTNDGGTLTVTSGATLYVVGTLQNNATGTLCWHRAAHRRPDQHGHPGLGRHAAL